MQHNGDLSRVWLLQILSPVKNLKAHTILHQIPFRSNKSHHNYTLVMGKVGCLVNVMALIVVCLRSSVLKVDISGAVKEKGGFRFWITSDSWRVYFCFRSLCIAAILWR